MAAAWFYRFCRRLAYGGVAAARTGERPVPKTRASRWLVWSGIGLVLGALAVTGMGMFGSSFAATAGGAPSPPQVAASVARLVPWVLALLAAGNLLLFLGLVRPSFGKTRADKPPMAPDS